MKLTRQMRGELNPNLVYGGAGDRPFLREHKMTLGEGLVVALEELEPFLMTMVVLALADHGAVGDVERRKERGGAVANIVVRHRPARPFFSGKPGCVRSKA